MGVYSIICTQTTKTSEAGVLGEVVAFFVSFQVYHRK